jgi:hypothetical protein
VIVKNDKLVSLSVTICFILIITGCGGKVTVRSADSLYINNPIKDVAVIAEGKVYYPRVGGKEAALGLAESKKALEILIAQTKREFEEKNYTVVFAKPAGIGYCDPARKDNWVFEDYENNDTKWQVQNCEPVYEYPIDPENQEAKNAIRNVFEQIQIAINKRKINAFSPSPNDVQVIGSYTGADTICFNRVYGQKYTTARKVGAMASDIAIGVAFALVGGTYAGSHSPEDTLESYFICVDTTNANVLWQHGLFEQRDPIDPGDSYIKEILEPFPMVGQPMDSKYKAE